MLSPSLVARRSSRYGVWRSGFDRLGSLGVEAGAACVVPL
ncbi:hypothetical protein FM119_10760 [Mycetocola reblochoni REB411]|uniref:Uncharacterized protein n=1 Tax=Mycetocola reblochoni REB411 TaxID=1255698 RepID=A0A1R4K1D7_9MICO|nr:hypothetical protein FM119_10760 [Mycetocola reblochoni REB411]